MSDDEDTRYELHIPADLLSQWFAEAEDFVMGDAEEKQQTMDVVNKAGVRFMGPRAGRYSDRRKGQA